MTRRLAALTISFLLLPSVLQADLLVDHVEYMRSPGSPQEMSIFFPACDPTGAYTLTVKNGQDDAHRATTGSVTVNGVEIVGPTDFAQTPAPAVITRTIGNVAERNTLALSATAPQGSMIGWQVTAEVICPDITITTPVPGEVFNRKEIIVKGRVRHRTPEVGVSVNGVLAQVNGNDWVANGVELAAGASTLTVTAISEDGATAEASVSVTNQDANTPRIVLGAAVGSGIASANPKTQLKAEFAVENYTRRRLVNCRVDYEGDGTFDLEIPTLEAFDHTYPTEGLFSVTVVARDEEGTEYSAVYVVNVHPLPPLKSKWEKMKAALADGDIAAATRDFSADESERQPRAFAVVDAMHLRHPEVPSVLPTVAAEMKDIQLIILRGGTAKYRLPDPVDVDVAYVVHFIRDDNGIWKIDSF